MAGSDSSFRCSAKRRGAKGTATADMVHFRVLPAMPSVPAPVTFFRPRRGGAECAVEDCVIDHLPTLFASVHPAWTAGSLPLGAGMPDLIVAAYQPLVVALAGAGTIETSILAYLRVVGRARLDTIATRLRLSSRNAEDSVSTLTEAGAVTDCAGRFSLTPVCRDILPAVTAIEVKVDNWQRALSQALRNRIFAHRSFIALPAGVATRVRRAPALLQSGIGVIAIDGDGGASIVRQATASQPRVWPYYYKLAVLVANGSARVQ
jgi:hypothetical protein